MMFPYFEGQRQRLQAYKEQQPHRFWERIGIIEKNFLLWKSLLIVSEDSGVEIIQKACDDVDMLIELLKGETSTTSERASYTVSFI
jgi:hypothetical protein